ncbi:hypothetical protein D3C75_710220 [compost metagenome]
MGFPDFLISPDQGGGPLLHGLLQLLVGPVQLLLGCSQHHIIFLQFQRFLAKPPVGPLQLLLVMVDSH